MAVLVLPIMLLNFLSGIVGGIWLAIESEWGLIGIGIGITIGGTFLASVLLLPSLLVGVPAVMAAERGNAIVAGVFGSLSLLFTYAIMAIWAVTIFYFFITQSFTPIACLLWAYSTATVTWSYMAQAESHSNEYSPITAFFHQIGCIALMVYGYYSFRNPDWAEMLIWYGVPVVFGAAFSIFVMLSNSKQSY